MNTETETHHDFTNLQKFSTLSAADLLAQEGIRLQTEVLIEPEVTIPDLLAALRGKNAAMDRLRIIAHALPRREAVWWSCLAAREMLPEGAKVPDPLAAAEAWVFKPSDATRNAAEKAANEAAPRDLTAFCASAAVFGDGKMGTGELAKHPAPAGALGTLVWNVLLKAMLFDPPKMAEAGDRLIARGLDIARGGNGRLKDAT